MGNYNISQNALDDVIDYIHDNTDMEIKTKSNESVCKLANKNVVNKCESLNKNNINQTKGYYIGAKKGGYDNILKRLRPYVIPHDPMVDYFKGK